MNQARRPVHSSRVRGCGDQALTRALRLPAQTSTYTINRGVRTTMRDGVVLVADHYAPTGPAVGTVLVRGPYGRSFPGSALYARIYAARGYHVLLQSCRGTGGSTGVFSPMVHEFDDGFDTVDWLRRQPWFTGRFATIGLSYLGFTQLALLRDPPPELAAAVVGVGVHDFAVSAWGTGAFSLSDWLGWNSLIAHRVTGRASTLIRLLRARRRLARATGELPLGRAGRALLGEGAPWYESWLEHSHHEDPFWSPVRLTPLLDRVTIPVQLIGGWQDVFLAQTLEQYRLLRRGGADVALTIGPWTHADMTTRAASRVARDTLRWLDRHLGAKTIPQHRDPVRVWVNGHGWVNLGEWPPANSEPQVLFPASPGALSSAPPPEATSTYHYDPRNPTPTIGGPVLFAPQGGYRQDNRLAERTDVLSFTSDVLAEDRYVMGSPVAELAHSADKPHVDVFVRVSEVDADGRSRNVSEGYRRLTASREPQVISVELDSTAHRFRTGSRIRLLIAGGSHPRFDRNPGTGEPAITAERLVGVTHTIHHGALSRLVLPVTAPPASPDGDPNPVDDLA